LFNNCFTIDLEHLGCLSTAESSTEREVMYRRGSKFKGKQSSIFVSIHKTKSLQLYQLPKVAKKSTHKANIFFYFRKVHQNIKNKSFLEVKLITFLRHSGLLKLHHVDQ
jgi:hypothetical protein